MGKLYKRYKVRVTVEMIIEDEDQIKAETRAMAGVQCNIVDVNDTAQIVDVESEELLKYLKRG